jgi:dTDP-glucose 4,6-dehydratase
MKKIISLIFILGNLMSRLKVLCTGTCGFIFGNFIRKAIYEKQPYSFVSIDRVNANAINSMYWNKNHTFHVADIRDQHVIDVIFQFEKPDIVIHGAAESVREDTIIPYMGPTKIEHLEIKQLWDRFSKRNTIETRNDGVEIINLNSEQQRALTIKNGFGQWKKIKQISRHWYSGNLINMRQKWGEIDVTPNHSIYNSDMELTTPNSDVELLSVRSIQPSHGLKHKIEKFGDYKWKTSIDDLLFMIAFYITEGSAFYNKKNGSYVLDFSQNNIEDLYRIQKIFNDNFNINGSITVRKCSSFRVSNKKLYNAFIKECKQYSDKKLIPSFIFKLQPHLQKLFIQYLIRFDGHKYSDTNLKYSTNSRFMAAQLSTLFSLVKQDYSYSRKVHKNPNWKDSYCFNLSMKQNKLNKSIYEAYPYDGYVYDLEVDDTHKFVCGLGNVVVHNTHVDNSLNDPNSFVTSNVLGTQVLVNAAIKHGVKKFIYISTDEVYGQLTSENEPSWTEDAVINPRNPYAATKAAGELIVKAAHQSHGLIYNITRSANNYGPRQTPDKLVPKAIKNILQNKPIPIYGQGLQIRDWTHVFDNCSGIMTVLNNGEPNQIYNISANQEFTNIEIIQKICNTMNSGHNLISFIDDPRKNGHDFRYSIDSSKLKKIGWNPTIKFKEGIEQCILWYNNNQWWFK